MIFNPTIIKKGGDYGAYNVNSVLLEDGTQELQITSATEKPVNKLPSLNDGTITEITAEDLEGVTKLRINAFYDCFYLKKITIPKLITEVGNSAFANCMRLEEINYLGTINDWLKITWMPSSQPTRANSTGVLYINGRPITEITVEDLEGISTIPDYSFKNCIYLTKVELPEDIQSIGASAFHKCNALPEIIIPANVISIDTRAFYSCNNLTTVTIEATTPPTLDSLVFTNTSPDLKIYVPAESVEAYKQATNWTTYADKIVAIGGEA